MSIATTRVRERHIWGDAERFTLHRSLDESYVVRYWWSLTTGSMLPLVQGKTCRVVFVGYPGSAAGPDVRDAVLSFASSDTDDTRHVVGDVEFHLRASDWVAHQHHTDARYNAVILHVVLLCDTPLPTTRQDGVIVPVCSLYDLASPPDALASLYREQSVYPCQQAMWQRSDEERMQLLRRAGMVRFEQKTEAFIELLHALSEHEYDLCLIPALAEGLAYGRDRAFFRAIALRLLGLPHSLPEPLGRASSPAPLDASRLAAIETLVARRQRIWPSLRAVCETNQRDVGALLSALRTWLYEYKIRPARADILLCNVVLPFIAAVALLEHDDVLKEHAMSVYAQHPGLTSNRVTRMMTKQLTLAEEPRGACVQQGLHYIYQQTCREKQCDTCLAGRKPL